MLGDNVKFTSYGEHSIDFHTSSRTKPKAMRWSTVFDTNARWWMSGVLLTADLFSLLASILLALEIRQLPQLFVDPSYIRIFGLLAITLVVLLASRDLYPDVGLNYVDELRLLTTSTTLAFSVILGITFLLKTTAIYSRIILVITWILSLIFIPSARYLIRQCMIRLKVWGEPVVIIGRSEKIPSVLKHFLNNLQLGLRPVAALAEYQGSTDTLDNHNSHSTYSIKTHARILSLQTALVMIDDFNEIDLLVERYRTLFHRVILIKDKNGGYGLNSLEALDFSHVLGLQVKNNLLDPWPQALKRLIDILGSAVGLIVLAPILGIVGLCIYIDSPGRIFYRQKRLGHDGKTFTLLKFRTMHLGAAQVLANALAQDPALKMEWDTYQKLKNDPRITRVGAFLRKFSLDEFPQLWNVLRGDMSLVGPRPIMPDQGELYGDAIHSYVQVTPGMTGLWQVSGRNHTTFARRAELDHEYIQRWSMWLDIYILLKTVKVVFWQNGAY